MKSRLVLLPLLLSMGVSLLMSACGGGGEAETPPPIVEPQGPGQLLAAQRLTRLSTSEVRQALAAQGSAAVAVVPQYDVEAYRLEYLSSDANGAPVRASGLVALPVKRAGAASPVLSYQHPTIFRDAQAPSNALGAGELPLVLASLGYLTVAADYVGYGVSRGQPHPYLLAAPSAEAVLDLLTAARTWRLRNAVADNGQLFLAGYSEGGYATLAAHRALERGGAGPLRNALVAVVPGAGPYDLGATLDAQLDRVRQENPVLGALISPGFLSQQSASVRNEVRRLLVRALLPGDADVVYDTRFIDAYLGDDRALIASQSNVHDWAPTVPLRLFHGRDDLTVPYVSSSRTLAAMQARGSTQVTLTDCPAQPAGHLECVPAYLQFLLSQLGQRARDL